MSDTTTRNLAREVAVALGWKIVHPDWMSEGHYELYMPNGRMIYSNGFGGVLNDEMIDGALPNHPNDLNACARDLTMEGYRAVLRQTVDLWEAYFVPVYTDGQLTVYGSRIDETEREDTNPAVAWCEAFLALCKHVDGKAGEGR